MVWVAQNFLAFPQNRNKMTKLCVGASESPWFDPKRNALFCSGVIRASTKLSFLPFTETLCPFLKRKLATGSKRLKISSKMLIGKKMPEKNSPHSPLWV